MLEDHDLGFGCEMNGSSKACDSILIRRQESRAKLFHLDERFQDELRCVRVIIKYEVNSEGEDLQGRRLESECQDFEKSHKL